MGVAVKIEPGALDVFAQPAFGVCLGDSFVHDVDQVAILTADVDVALMRVGGEGRDQHPFNQLVRVVFDQQTIFASGRLTLVGVDDDVSGFGRILRDKAPLHAGGEAGASASAEIGDFHL